MAGSLYHIVDDTGVFTMDLIENIGDAHEALEECFYIIQAMTGGTKEEVNVYLIDLGYPAIEHDMSKNRRDE